MNALVDAMNHAALGWVKPELDDIFRQARGEIEAFAQAPAEPDRMRFCASHLHQAAGTLRMLELHAPAMVAEELELLVEALAAGSIGDRDEAFTVLMRGTVLLPDYLERLQSGHRDIPIVLLPLLNEIRAARGEAALSESVLLACDPSVGDVSPIELEHARGSLSGRNRELLDSVGNAVKEELMRIKDALDLHLRTGGEASGLRSQAGELSALADTLGMLGLTTAREVVVQQLDALRRIVDGEQVADEASLLDIAGALLYVDASLDEQIASLSIGRDEPSEVVANAAEVRRTVEVLAHEALVNFAAAREHFVAFIETHWDHGRLTEVPHLLDEVAGALRILDRMSAADYVQAVRHYVQRELIEPRRIPNGRQLDTLADAMASLEYYLEALRERRAGREEILDITRSSLEALQYWPLPDVQPAAVGRIESASLDPPAVEYADLRVSEPAPLSVAGGDALGDDIERIALADAASGEAASGVLPDDDESEPLPMALPDRVWIEQEPPSSAAQSHDDPARIDTAPLGDESVAAIEPPLPEAVSEIASATPPPDERDVPVAMIGLDEVVSSPASLEPDPVSAGSAPTSPEEAASRVTAAPALPGGFEYDGVDIDDEIREVFLEEFDEERGKLGELLPAWRAAPDDFEQLRPIRRVFHTLKGSGRLVGARTLGEFSWKIENMLNRVLDGSRPPSQAVMTLLEQVYDEVLPQFDAALRHGALIQVDLIAMQAVVERIAAGEDVLYAPAQPHVATVTAVPTPTPTPTPISEVAAEGTPAFVDSVLREILEAEVATHLVTVHAWLQASQAEPQPVTEQLLRAVHTMGGAFAMTDVPEITEVTSPAENFLKRALAAEATPTREAVSAIAETAEAIFTTIAALQSDAPRIPAFVGLQARLRTLAESLPAAQWPPLPVDEGLESDAESASPVGSQALAAIEDVSLDPYAPAAGTLVQTLANGDEDSAGVLVYAASPSIETDAPVIVEVPAVVESSTQGAESMFAGDDAGVGDPEGGPAGAMAPVDADACDGPTQIDDAALSAVDPSPQLTVVEAELSEPAPISAPASVEPVATETPLTDFVVNSAELGPLDFQVLDRELVGIFVEEGKDLLDHCDGLLAGLRESPDEHELLIGLQRDLHTLKGGARTAGIVAIGDLAHGIESLLEAVVSRRTTLAHEDIDLLERGFDRLHQLLMLTGNQRAVAMPSELIECFDIRADESSEVAAAAFDARPRPATEPVVLDPLSGPIPAEPQADEEFPPDLHQEQVRVRAELLDRLVNYAGEVAIYRSRLEQQLGAFRGAMSELDRTNIRLRDQLRRLDLETEAQIVSRYQREHEQGERNFDPLELDRFSNLQQLSRALNESAADMAGLQGVLDDLARQYDGLLQLQSRVSSELQDGLMHARMVPFDSLLPRLRRLVRQAAAETGRQVQLLLEGAHGELDRNVLEHMVAPLEHMLRNAVAHGLELPQARRAAGKPETGTITVRLRRDGSEIVLDVADDGAGLDHAAIRRRGEQRGLIAPGASLEDSELKALIFASGFSTVERVSQLAGRGVGLDVVRNEVAQLGGALDVHSEQGRGTTFSLRLPQMLAVTQAVFVRIGESTFAVPVASVSGIGRIGRDRYAAGDGGYRYAGQEYLLYDLGTLLGQAAVDADGAAQVPLLLVRSGDLHAAVAVDQVLGNREIVVKPVGPQIVSVPGIYGATITGDGRVVVILDIAPWVRRHLNQPARAPGKASVRSAPTAPLVMVVDDSLTMRKVTGRVLERHNFDVATARDGVEALEKLAERVPDLMLLDIEMPRMDGYELATAMRSDPRYESVPIVMITSRSGDKHRQRAFEIGVQRYLGKPYQELDLMRTVYDVLGLARVRP